MLAAWAGLIAFLVLPIAIVGDGFGISIFFVATLVFVLCLRKLIRRKRPADRQLAMAEEESVASPAVVEQAFEPEADPRIIVAWKIARFQTQWQQQRL